MEIAEYQSRHDKAMISKQVKTRILNFQKLF